MPWATWSRVIAARSISPRGADGRPALPFLPAVRFEVDFPEGPTAVWVVHVRSPRTDFKKYREWQRWKWIWDRPADLHQRETLQGYWQEQAAAIEYLKSQIAADTLPVLVLGDWNVPDSGPRYAEVTRGLIDAHRAAGTGYGYTFPGDLQVGLAAGRPWMRIDYILAQADAWEVLHCQVQDDAANSQHRAVLARLRRRRPLPKAPPSTPLTAPRAAAAGHLR